MKFTRNQTTFSVYGAALATLLLALLVAGAPGRALAHAEVVSSSPANGSTVPEGLTDITIVFDEEAGVSDSGATLKMAGGADVAGVTGGVDRTDRKKMTLKTPPLGAGSYVINWRAFSEDDNNYATGTIAFTVASAEGGQGGGGEGTTPPDDSSLPTSGVGDVPILLGAALVGLMFVAAGVVLRGRVISR